MSQRQLSRYLFAEVSFEAINKLIIRFRARDGWFEEIRLPEWVEQLDLVSWVDVDCSYHSHYYGNFMWEVFHSLISARVNFTRAVERARDIEKWLICKKKDS